MMSEPKGLWLLVDDEKNLKADLVARTYAEGQDLLRKHIDQIAVLMLDYWLGGSRTGGDFIEWFLAEKLLPESAASQPRLLVPDPASQDAARSGLPGRRLLQRLVPARHSGVIEHRLP